MAQAQSSQPLTLAEVHLWTYAGAGELIECWVAGAKLEEQIIRGSFLRALLCGEVSSPATGKPINELRTLRIHNALVVGHLDLSECGGVRRLPHLDLSNVILTGGASFNAANLGRLRISGCCILGQGISAEGARCDGNLTICDCRFAPNAFLGFAQIRVEGNCTFSNLSCVELQPQTILASTVLQDTIQRRRARAIRDGREDDYSSAAEADAAHDLGSPLSAAEVSPLTAPASYRAMISGNAPGFAALVLRAAHITGDLSVGGLYVASCTHRCGRDGGCSGKHIDDSAALDAERVQVQGNLSIGNSAEAVTILRGGINLSLATVSGHLRIAGTRVICGGQKDAINAESSVIKGDLVVEEYKRTRSSVRGGFRILGIHIQGQFQLHGVLLCARTSGAGTERAITGDGARIENDLFIRGSAENSFASTLRGMVGLPGATIGGQFGILGTRVVSEHPTNPAISMRDITVKGGIFLAPFGRRCTQVCGEIRLNDALITGVLEVVGSRLRAASNGDAINANGATIKADLLIARHHPDRISKSPQYEGCRISGCIRIAGATIGGRLRILGAFLRSHPSESALIGSGASIKGGFFIEPSHRAVGHPVPCTIRGTLRLNHAQIGSRVHFKAAVLHASSLGQKIAISANGAVIAGDLILGPDEEQKPCRVYGEIRILGARLGGALKIQAGKLRARSDGAASGFAVDAYNAEIAKGVILAPYRADGSGDPRPLSIFGLLGFAYTKLGSFSLGESPRLSSPVNAQILTTVEGVLRLNGAQIVDFTALEQVRLCPPAAMSASRRALGDKIIKTLNRWDSTHPATVVSAQNANFGTRLSVRLSDESVGMLDLFGARAITLDDDCGNTLGWGKAATGNNWSSENMGGTLKGVCLNLNGFAYTRFIATPGFPSAAANSQLSLRTRWLGQQYPDHELTNERFAPDAYIQLTSVFRAQGLNREADTIICCRRKAQARYGTMGSLDRALQKAYGLLFGFGYDSKRAITLLVALLVVNGVFALVGSRQGWLVEASAPTSAPSVLNLSFSFTPSAKRSVDGVAGGTLGLPARTPDTPCKQWPLYAVDQSLPVIHVGAGNGCQVDGKASSPPQIIRVVLIFVAWIIVPAALLTFSGILRETNK